MWPYVHLYSFFVQCSVDTTSFVFGSTMRQAGFILSSFQKLSTHLRIHSMQLLRMVVLPLNNFVVLSCEIPVDASTGVKYTFPSFYYGSNYDGESSKKDPYYKNHDPASKEGFGEDIRGAVHWHWPQNDKTKG